MEMQYHILINDGWLIISGVIPVPKKEHSSFMEILCSTNPGNIVLNTTSPGAMEVSENGGPK